MRIDDEEFGARRAILSAALVERALSGAVLFDPQYVHYYTGFFFIPTERPIAFAMSSDGRGGMLVPRLELEHARANTAVSEVAHYDEYPGERHPMESLRELLDALGIRGALGADADGYPWMFGYRVPASGRTWRISSRTRWRSRAQPSWRCSASPAGGRISRTRCCSVTRGPASQRPRSRRVRRRRRRRRCSTRSVRSTADSRRTTAARPPAIADRSGAMRRSRTRTATTSSSRPATCS